MRPFKRVKMLDADEYRVLKRSVNKRKIAAGEARWTKMALLSNRGSTAREIAARLDCNETTALKRIASWTLDHLVVYSARRRARVCRGCPTAIAAERESSVPAHAEFIFCDPSIEKIFAWLGQARRLVGPAH